MPMVIKMGGAKKSTASKSKPAAKKTASTPAKRSTRATAKRATKASTAKKSTQAKKSSNGGAPRGPRTPKMDPKLLAKHVKALADAGSRRREAEEEHEAATSNVFEVVQDAIAAGVPMTIIANETKISRQWLYKMGNFRQRTNGSKPKAKAAAAKKGGTTAAKRTPAKRGSATRKPAAKAARPKIRVGGR